MTPRPLAFVLVAGMLAAPVFADALKAPYAGQQRRTIKALSADDVTALLKGEGMGFAKAAELTRIIQRGAIRPHDDTDGGVVFCGVEDAGIGV